MMRRLITQFATLTVLAMLCIAFFVVAVIGADTTFDWSAPGQVGKLQYTDMQLNIPEIYGAEYPQSASAITNGAVLTLGTNTVIVLNPTGQAATFTNTVTIGLPYVPDRLYYITIDSDATNVVKIADSTTVVSLGADVLLDVTDTLTLLTVETNKAVKISLEDN